MLDTDRWTDFRGYGPLPGVASAKLVRGPELVGSTFHVTNTDGSTHLEEICAWDPERALHLRMRGFTAPLCFLASSFDERWTMTPSDQGTKVTRTFTLHARSWLACLPLFFIRALLRRAVVRHLDTLARPD